MKTASILIVLIFAAGFLTCNGGGEFYGKGNPDSLIPRQQPIRPAITSKNWVNKWKRNTWQNEADLEIKNSTEDSIYFTLFAGSGGHTGEVEGAAYTVNDTAVYYSDEDIDTCMLQFILKDDSVITVHTLKGTCFAAMGVTYDGNYVNAHLAGDMKTPDFFTLGLLTKEEDAELKKLTGTRYAVFINSTQLTNTDSDAENLHAKALSSGVRGLFTFMENIIMVDSLHHIWAAVIDDDKVFYYTNDKAFAARLPKTIDHWRERFKQYPVIYVTKK